MSDTKDLVQRLRWMSKDTIGEQAADALERVTAERDALKAALQETRACLLWHYEHGCSDTASGYRLKIDEAVLRRSSGILAAQAPTT